MERAGHLRRAAARAGAALIEHHAGRRVLLASLVGEKLLPDILGVAEDLGGEAAPLILGGALPALLFFAAYYFSGIYVATTVLILSLFALVAIYWLKERRLHKSHAITAEVVVPRSRKSAAYSSRSTQWRIVL